MEDLHLEEKKLEQFPSAGSSSDEDDFPPGDPSLDDDSSSQSGTLTRRKEENILKAGYLKNEGRKLKNWRKRWFVLTSSALSYYVDQKQKTLVKRIPFAEILQVRANRERLEANLFELFTVRRPYYICANSEEDLEEWLFAIKYAMETLENLKGSEVQERRKEDGRVRSITVRDDETLQPKPRTDSEESYNPSLIVKSGYLIKQGDTVKNWKKRWFVLRNSSLAYYKTKDDLKPIRMIPLSECLQVEACEKVKKNCFGFFTSDRIFYICADTQCKMMDWINAITPAVTLFKKMSPNLAKISSITSELGEESDSSSEELRASLLFDPNEQIQRQGYMLKEGKTIKSWKKRWFVCAKTSLAYFKTEKSNQPIQIIDLRKCTAVLESAFEKGNFGIELVLPERTFNFVCDTKEDRVEWVRILRSIIASL